MTGVQRLHFLKGTGPDLGSALGGVGRSLVDAVCPAPPGLQGSEIELLCHGRDPKSLLLSWIELLLYTIEERQVALLNLDLKESDGRHLYARGTAVPLEGRILHLPRLVDADSALVTQEKPALWRAECRLIHAPDLRQWPRGGRDFHAFH